MFIFFGKELFGVAETLFHLAFTTRSPINQVRGETGEFVSTLRADNVGEYGSSEISEWLVPRHETSSPIAPRDCNLPTYLGRSSSLHRLHSQSRQDIDSKSIREVAQ